ncbi:HlyU family transcriptional regulator [Palleronia abyssalis]|uniref:Transcriptional activator HlyU n=1 Tax=Palleronia abyssalis TaxID=1501240 RepID=A0A2R8BV22_9RHOB|nr:HlyU family transcriptional regulator [Palleronia abyssalis]SPJ23975.1 hypothetical protein PAA8504_01797 [Palleronia abyssalis]
MSIWSRLFGKPKSSAPEQRPSESYKGFTIYPAPMEEGGQYRLAAIIEKEIAGETQSHHLVRADLLRDPELCAEAAVAKARTMIDEQGDRIFD